MKSLFLILLVTTLICNKIQSQIFNKEFSIDYNFMQPFFSLLSTR